MKKIFFLILLTISIAACVKMRDYTTRKHGGVVLFTKHEFGTGSAEDKEYYFVDDNTYVTLDDTRNEVWQKLGDPASKVTAVDGREEWLYLNKQVKLIFEDNKLRHWQSLKNDRALNS